MKSYKLVEESPTVEDGCWRQFLKLRISPAAGKFKKSAVYIIRCKGVKCTMYLFLDMLQAFITDHRKAQCVSDGGHPFSLTGQEAQYHLKQGASRLGAI